jgi:hypothetical protein
LESKLINRIKKLVRGILGEEWAGSIKSTWHREPILVDVFKNPSKGEITKMTKGGKSPVRFFIDYFGNLFVWGFGDAMHDEVALQLKLGYGIKGAYYNPSYVEFFKVKNPERVEAQIAGSKLMNVLDDDYNDNLLRKRMVH